MSQSERIPINEVAAQLGTSCRTLRYYEEIGLLEGAERGPGGVRQYSAADVERLKRIVDLRNSRGFTLEELKEFLAAEAGLDAIRVSFHGDSDVAARLQVLDEAERLLEHELAVVEAKMKGLSDLRAEIEGRLQRARVLRADLSGVSGPR